MRERFYRCGEKVAVLASLYREALQAHACPEVGEYGCVFPKGNSGNLQPASRKGIVESRDLRALSGSIDSGKGNESCDWTGIHRSGRISLRSSGWLGWTALRQGKCRPDGNAGSCHQTCLDEKGSSLALLRGRDRSSDSARSRRASVGALRPRPPRAPREDSAAVLRNFPCSAELAAQSTEHPVVHCCSSNCRRRAFAVDRRRFVQIISANLRRRLRLVRRLRSVGKRQRISEAVDPQVKTDSGGGQFCLSSRYRLLCVHSAASDSLKRQVVCQCRPYSKERSSPIASNTIGNVSSTEVSCVNRGSPRFRRSGQRPRRARPHVLPPPRTRGEARWFPP